MLAAFFDIPAAPAGGAAAFGKEPKAKARAAAKRQASRKRPSAPKPVEASTTTMRAGFEPLPPEHQAPRPAEEGGQAWQPLAGSGVTRDDDIAEFRADWWEEDADVQEEADDASEPDFEPESLEPCATETATLDSVAASPMDDDLRFFFAKRSRSVVPSEAAVYTGPQLCYEDDDFD